MVQANGISICQLCEKAVFSSEDSSPSKMEKLRMLIGQLRAATLEALYQNLVDLNDFDRGEYSGEIIAYDSILNVLKDVIEDE